MSLIRASDIRFTQDSIKSRFQNGGSVNEAADDVCAKRSSVHSFPSIQVVKWNNKYYSFDNRRLYVFRVAEYRAVVFQIPVKFVPVRRLNLDRFTTTNDGREVKVRGDRTLNHFKKGWLKNTASRDENVRYGGTVMQSLAESAIPFHNVENQANRLETDTAIDRYEDSQTFEDEPDFYPSSSATNNVRIQMEDDSSNDFIASRDSARLCACCTIM